MNIAGEQKLSPKQVAALYGISPAALCEWRKRKHGPAFMQPLPNKVIYLLSDCEKFFNGIRIETQKRSHSKKVK